MVMAEPVTPMGVKRTQLGEKLNNNNNNANNNNYPMDSNHNLYRVKQRKRKRLSAVLDKLHVQNNNVAHYNNNNNSHDKTKCKIKNEYFTEDHLSSDSLLSMQNIIYSSNSDPQFQIKSEQSSPSDLYFSMTPSQQFSIYLNGHQATNAKKSVLSLMTNYNIESEIHSAYTAIQEYPLDLSMKSSNKHKYQSKTEFNFVQQVPIIKGDVASNKTKESIATRYNLNVSPVVEEMPADSDLACICPICGQMFSVFDRLSKHIASRHKTKTASSNVVKSYVCDVCNRSFARSDMLTRHFRLHSGAKPYSCNSCGQVFSRSDHLSTHQRTHTGEKPYKCSVCSYCACRRDMITRHMRTHLRKENLKNGEIVNQKPILQLNIPPQMIIGQTYQSNTEIKIKTETLVDNNNSIIFTKTET